MPSFTERSDILRITNKTLKLLLELCKQHECLWNSNLEGYPDRYQRRRAAAEIADQLQIEGFTGEHVMRQFSNTRRYYCLELKKIALSEAMVARGEATQVRQPPAWFPIINSFMRPFVHPKTMGLEPRPKQKRKKKSRRVVTPMERELERVDSTSKENAEQPTIDLSDNEDLNDYQPKANEDTGKVEPSDQELEEFIVEHDLNIKEDPEEQNDQVQSTSTDYLLENVGDFHQCFGKYVASLLNKMPPEKALEVQPKILRLIFSNLEES